MKNTGNYSHYKNHKLKDAAYASAYLEAALEEYHNDHNKAAFLMALRELIEAKSSLANFAQKINLSRQSLYKALSPAGNPRLDTLDTVLSQLGFKLKVESITQNKKAA
jgi:probable addiction module antidote protein